MVTQTNILTHICTPFKYIRYFRQYGRCGKRRLLRLFVILTHYLVISTVNPYDISFLGQWVNGDQGNFSTGHLGGYNSALVYQELLEVFSVDLMSTRLVRLGHTCNVGGHNPHTGLGQTAVCVGICQRCTVGMEFSLTSGHSFNRPRISLETGAYNVSWRNVLPTPQGGAYEGMNSFHGRGTTYFV